MNVILLVSCWCHPVGCDHSLHVWCGRTDALCRRDSPFTSPNTFCCLATIGAVCMWWHYMKTCSLRQVWKIISDIVFPTLFPCTWQIEPPSMACLGYKQWWWGWIMRLLCGLHIINMMQIKPLLGCCWLERVNSVLAIKMEISSIFWKLGFFQFLCWNTQNKYIRVRKYWKWINNNIWGEEDKP